MSKHTNSTSAAFKKAAFLFIILFLLGFTPDYGDTIVIGSIGEPRTFVPILASDSSSGTICGLIFNGLVKYDKDLNLTGDLAEKWEVSQDGLEIIFYLRKGVKWHDGAPFTSKDVEFTYKSLIDPNVRTPYGGDFQMVKSLEVIDDYTLKVFYKEPFSPGLASWGMNIMPAHLLEKEDLNTTKFTRNPIGTGPYKFKLWKTGERVELVSNRDYFEGRPYIDRYIYRIIPDTATLFLELRAQAVDYTSLTPIQYRRQTETEFFKKNFQRFNFPSFGYTYMGYNLKDPKFKDVDVRRAINYAVNKEEIIKGVLLGLGRISTGPFIPESWAYNKDVLPLEYNPGKAKELLKNAGWSDSDRDGILEKDGMKFSFTVITNQGNDERKMALEIIQRRLREVGIEVKIKIIEWSAFVSEFIDKRRFEAVLLGWGLSLDPDMYDIWHSSKTKQGEFNFVSYSNAEVDDLLLKGRRTFNQEERKKIYQKIHKILYEDQPYLFLYVPDALPVLHSRFKGVEVAPSGIGYNFIKWFVPRSEQRYTR
ncbi:MAG TPA: peptide-binding protein [Candidatus Omnitrophica bacterium]|nr:peptide-binding protein [Candidatus Omnitrophota bacterium]